MAGSLEDCALLLRKMGLVHEAEALEARAEAIRAKRGGISTLFT